MVLYVCTDLCDDFVMVLYVVVWFFYSCVRFNDYGFVRVLYLFVLILFVWFRTVFFVVYGFVWVCMVLCWFCLVL